MIRWPFRSKPSVGYCRPPVEHRFAKGKSGNPAGRPKGSTKLARLAKERKKVVDAYVAAGFTEQQAFDLMKRDEAAARK